MAHTYTIEEIEELKKCSESYEYFINKYATAYHPIHGNIPVTLEKRHKEILNHIHDNKISGILAYRQSGKTLISALYALWILIFKPNCTVAIISKNIEMSTESVCRIRYAYDNLPDFLRIPVIVGNRKTIKFENGSRVYARSGINSTRGMSLDLVIIDEFAFIPSDTLSDIWLSSVPTAKKIIAISTPSLVKHSAFVYQLFDSTPILKISCYGNMENENIYVTRLRLTADQFSREYECNWE